MESELIKPKGINSGKPMTIGVIAAGSPPDLSESEKRAYYRELRSKGFKIKEAKQCCQVKGHTAGSIQERVKDLEKFFADPQIDIIMDLGGGFQSHQLLEYLDYELIKNNPKPIVGYSDTTALLVGIHARTNMVTFTGPEIISFHGCPEQEYTWESFSSCLKGEKVIYEKSRKYSDLCPDKNEYISYTTKKWKSYRPGVTDGHIVAANLSTLLLLNNTDYWPNLNGAILIIEEDGEESPETIDRMFTQLRHIGVFKQINGLAIGRFPQEISFCESDSLELILEDALRGYQFPVLLDIDYGHTDPLITLPLGVRAKLDADKGKIELLESPVLIQ